MEGGGGADSEHQNGIVISNLTGKLFVRLGLNHNPTTVMSPTDGTALVWDDGTQLLGGELFHSLFPLSPFVKQRDAFHMCFL